MAPSVFSILLAVLPLVAGVPDPSPAEVKVVNPDSPANMDNNWVVVFKKDADAKTIEARQAHFANTLRKRNIGKRDGEGNAIPMESKDYALGDFRATACQTDPKTMNLMIAEAGDTVDWVECNQRIEILQQPQQQAAKPPNFDFQSAADAKQKQGGPQGQGMTVYIMDTGINTEHEVFGGRATRVANLVQNESDEDLNGHGTHTAGSAAGLGVGIAPQANVSAVKILDAEGKGGGDSILGGFQAACADVEQKQLRGKCVVNMSLGTEKSNMVNQAAQKMSDCGCAVVVAAGNEDRNAAVVSPASSDGVITVGATDSRTNEIAPFSNRGNLIDVSTNGVNVISADAKTNDGFKSLTGTSMASPQVAGKALEVLSTGNIKCDADCTNQVRTELQNQAKQSKPATDEPGALTTSTLQLDTSNDVPVDPNGSTPVGAGARKNGASKGFDVAAGAAGANSGSIGGGGGGGGQGGQGGGGGNTGGGGGGGGGSGGRNEGGGAAPRQGGQQGGGGQQQQQQQQGNRQGAGRNGRSANGRAASSNAAGTANPAGNNAADTTNAAGTTNTAGTANPAPNTQTGATNPAPNTGTTNAASNAAGAANTAGTAGTAGTANPAGNAAGTNAAGTANTAGTANPAGNAAGTNSAGTANPASAANPVGTVPQAA